ncbi:hypothetical protein GGR54DRAFT_628839 [Hypoxylon sp. NC1633]|nr:hypothetical protein GGR54DRAFT_628839 [Hypoxylon sp. NC1633]
MLRRPNGRLQACDPCRKRKLACDHTQPVCNRCRKRRQNAECVYDISGPQPSPASSTRPSASWRRTTQPSQNGLVVTPDTEVPNSAGSGYLGPTSYCTVYDEIFRGSQSATSQTDNVYEYPALERSNDIMSPRVREMCLRVLRNLPGPTTGGLIRHTHCVSDGWIFPIAARVVRSLYDTYGQYLGNDRSIEKLEEMARKFCMNTTRPLSDNESDPDRWTSQFSGENMRWEIVGLLSIFWEYVPGSETALLKGRRSPEYDTAFRMKRENVYLCNELCKEFSPGNSLMLYLSQRCAIIHSLVVGDANLLVWRAHAETVSLLTFLGFHALEEKDRRQASMASEVKKILFHHLLSMSMGVVSFTGRPPLLSSRCASTPLPLDISDEVMFSDHDTFIKAVERLDDKGWNTDGMVYISTRIRARAMLAQIKEELFYLALKNDQSVSVEALLQLRARELRTVSEFPASLQFNPADLENPDIPISVYSTRLIVQQEHLQNIFFVERLLLRHGHADSGDLLKVSYDLVILTLPWDYLNIDRLGPFRNDAEWIVMAYGVPAGGILCLELLKPTLHNRPHSDPKITRSNIIQKLSLLVAFLDWISPSGPNGELCNDAKSIIQRVLDQSLNAVPSLDEPPAFLDWDFSTQLDFNFDLLDTFDWNRPDFPLSQQSNQ